MGLTSFQKKFIRFTKRKIGDTECPICSTLLQIHGGEVLNTFGSTSEEAKTFGKDIVSLECGHRLHRFCLVSWLQTTLTPTCPLCRNETQWQPTIEERTGMVQLVQQGWKNLPSGDQRFLKIVWIIAGIASLTDPAILVSAAFLLSILLPPTLLPTVLVFLGGLNAILGKGVLPGSRVFFILGIASTLTFLTLANRASTD